MSNVLQVTHTWFSNVSFNSLIAAVDEVVLRDVHFEDSNVQKEGGGM